MTGGNAPLGRRDNGLYTTDYAVVADVDPRIGEHLLEVLGDRGIAAYLKPTSDENPVTRSAMLPSPPMDRLYVDRGAVPVARRLLAEATSGATDASDAIGVTPAEPAPSAEGESGTSTLTAPTTRESDDFEAAWALIVAGYDATAAPERGWPLGGDGTAATMTPDLPTADPGVSDPGASDPTAPPRPSPLPPPSPAERTRDDDRPAIIKPVKPYLNDDRGSLLDGLDSFGAGLPDDDEEDFKPPAPPPLPRIGPAAITGVLAIVVGLLAVFAPDVVPTVPNTDIQVMGGVLVLVGAVLLISRLRSGADDDERDDPDDGAVV